MNGSVELIVSQNMERSVENKTNIRQLERRVDRLEQVFIKIGVAAVCGSAAGGGFVALLTKVF